MGLQRFDKDHPGLLGQAPDGIHAVAPIPERLRGEVKTGVIFFLRQNDEARDPKDANPIFPYYLVYVTSDGSRMSKLTQPKGALDLMRAACTGQAVPITDLCKQFNRENRDGTRMDGYTELLNGAVASITGVQETTGIDALFDLGEVGSGVSLGFDDYSLVSFVVLR